MSKKFKFQVDYARDHYIDTYEEAEKLLRRKADKDRDEEWFIYQAIAKAEQPVPEIKVLKLS